MSAATAAITEVLSLPFANSLKLRLHSCTSIPIDPTYCTATCSERCLTGITAKSFPLISRNNSENNNFTRLSNSCKSLKINSPLVEKDRFAWNFQRGVGIRDELWPSLHRTTNNLRRRRTQMRPSLDGRKSCLTTWTSNEVENKETRRVYSSSTGTILTTGKYNVMLPWIKPQMGNCEV